MARGASEPAARLLISVVGARPNFMKVAPIVRALRDCGHIAHQVVHTGQHYDPSMSADFFRDLDLPRPLCNLEVGSGSHAQQTALVMQRLEPVLRETRPAMVLVYGDVNSTLAAALVAAKLGIPVAHVEAGLRSRDRAMPEEINRVLTDRLADSLLAPSRDAVENLLREGTEPERIYFVGNVMIDTLVSGLESARARNLPQRYGVEPEGYGVVTLHRPGNVDDPARLTQLCRALIELGRDLPLLFPVHPRTRARLPDAAWTGHGARVRALDPLSYLDMLGLIASAALVITDSGGLQEETTYLGTPCLTIRPTTERPITCTEGTNRLVAPTPRAILDAARSARRTGRRPASIEGWDGRAAQRIAAVLTASGARGSPRDLVTACPAPRGEALLPTERP
ncbi:MAG TPA: UDP-N-acetylglucosamine 2-epimerase (non-hydrolyzing) [Gemmatimonadales bacterium]|jgi:UDP-N-acetylglucosamine 2-epimerase (non-hydrolysing)|nr:UDP-N-acetylglucosamine 2-epimerase (non-hydrolyzing) [Gemmatimonadales bacterium]